MQSVVCRDVCDGLQQSGRAARDRKEMKESETSSANNGNFTISVRSVAAEIAIKD
jgi:hypothetical protein